MYEGGGGWRGVTWRPLAGWVVGGGCGARMGVVEDWVDGVRDEDASPDVRELLMDDPDGVRDDDALPDVRALSMDDP